MKSALKSSKHLHGEDSLHSENLTFFASYLRLASNASFQRTLLTGLQIPAKAASTILLTLFFI